MRTFLKIALLGYFGFVLASCGQVDFGLRDLSSKDSFTIPSQFFAVEKKVCYGDLEFTVIPEVIGAGVVFFDEQTIDLKTGQLNLSIFADGRFEARYREFDFENTLFDHSFTGNYTFNPLTRTITFPQLGEGLIKPRRSSYMMTLTFSHNLSSTNIFGQKLDLFVRMGAVPASVNGTGCQ